jgi:hypothetical protein
MQTDVAPGGNIIRQHISCGGKEPGWSHLLRLVGAGPGRARMEGIGGGILNWAAAVANCPQTEGDSDGLDS